MAKKKGHPFNVLMDEDDWKRLSVLAERKGYSKGMLVRELVRRAYTMEVGGLARCATGEACLVPAVWAQRSNARREG